MKNVIDPLFSRKFKFIALFAYWVQNSKKSEKLCLQLPVLLGLNVFAI